jgi:hypothetical protein
LVTLIAIHNKDVRYKQFNKAETSKTDCAEKPVARREK